MLEFKRSDEFTAWFRSLGEPIHGLITEQLDSIAFNGIFPPKTSKRLTGTGGVSELIFDFGSGYRVYYCRYGNVVYLLLSGGIKRDQRTDIKQARAIMRREIGIRDLEGDNNGRL